MAYTVGGVALARSHSSSPWSPPGPPGGYGLDGAPSSGRGGGEDSIFENDTDRSYDRFFGDSRFTVPVPSVHGSVGDRTASASGSGGGAASPASLPPLERAGSSSEDEDLPELEEIDIDGGNAHRGGGQSEAPPAPAPVAEEPTPTQAAPPRQSQRAAAQRATARISAALHSGGMADLDGAWWSVPGTVSTRPSAASATASGAGGGSDDEGAAADAASSRAQRRRAGGPKTTGEEESPEPPAPTPTPLPLRRSTRKRSAAAASHLGDGPEDAPPGVTTKRAAAGPKTTGEADDAKKEEENAESEESCCICLDVPDRYELSSLNGCEHLYCFSCIEKWADRENTCPQCKKRFTKIERVHRPPPNKRRKKGGESESAGGNGEGSASSRAKNSKRVRNRDQRADVMSHGNPLQGLFATMEANGTMPHSIAQLIFSGLGGINGGLMEGAGAPRRTGGAAFAGRGPPAARASHPIGVDPFHPHAQVPEPLNALVRGLSSRIDGVPVGARAAAAASSAPPPPPPRGRYNHPMLSLASDPWSPSAGSSLASSLASSSTGMAAAGAPAFPPHQHIQHIQRGGRQTIFDDSPFRRHSSGSGSYGEDTTSDDTYDYGDFVQRVQRSVAAGRAAGMQPPSSADRFAVGGVGGTGGGVGDIVTASVATTRAVPTASGGPGSSAANALEIDDDSDDDDDDEVIEVIEVPHD